MRSRKSFVSKLQAHSCVISANFTFRGERISKRDAQIISDAFYLWILTIEELANPRSSAIVRQQLCQLYFLLHNCDLALLVSLLKRLDGVWKHLPPDCSMNYALFKGEHLGGKLYSGHLLTPLAEFFDFSTYGARGSLATVLAFVTRVNIILDIEDEMIADYHSDECRLESLPTTVGDSLNHIMVKWFGDWNIGEDDKPRHGPGSVSGHGRISVAEKSYLLDIDTRLHYFLTKDVAGWETYYPFLPGKLNRQAEVVFVPKTMTSYRTICKEPATLQYFQQLVARSITGYLRKHEYLKHRIDLKDQTRSQEEAQKASLNREYVTIDLSRASDSVSYSMVKRAFRGTNLMRALVATRSDQVLLPNREVIQLKKFAPMGSALCFPIECIIFAAICENCLTPGLSRRQRHYRVYGDDLIVHHSVAKRVIDELTAHGFIVNMDKSFYSLQLPFRESCGGEYYNGVPTSPLRLPRNFSGITKGSNNKVMLVDLANRFYRYGLRSARNTIIRVLLADPFPPLFTERGGPGIWSDTPNNFHLKKVKSRGQTMYVHGGIKSRRVHTALDRDDNLRLFYWYLNGSNPEGTTHIGKVQSYWGVTKSPVWFSMLRDF